MNCLFQLMLSLILILATSVFAAQNKFDSAHAVALNGVITRGEMLTRSSSSWSYVEQIEQQLMYVIGQLNGLNGGSPDMSKVEISVNETEKLENGYYRVRYAAKLFIAWPEEQFYPRSYTLILPRYADYNGLTSFFKKYGNDEHSAKKCLAWEAHDVTPDMFWYYYRPQKNSCPLKVAQFEEDDLAITLDIQLSRSKKNTTGKAPEYEKVWEDGKLVVTGIFGMADADSNSSWDAGVVAYRETVQQVLKRFGTPVSTTPELPASELNYFSSPKKYPTLRMVFNTEKGEVDIVLALITGIQQVYSSDEFTKLYNKRTRISDFVSYSGHSGLGANIRKLARMGDFVKDQYQIFLINGCDTFAYVDDSLRDAHKAVNPGYGPDKFFDIITNAMPSYFHMNARSNMSVINALYEAKATYKEILSRFDPQQRAVVTGEEDNAWPASFY